MLLVHMASGLTARSFGGRIGVTPKTITDWIDKHPLFYAFHEAGLQFQRMDWEQTLVDMAKGKTRGNAAAAIFALKNYFPDDYKDKREVEMAAGAGMILVDTGIKRNLPVFDPESGKTPRINRRKVYEAESRVVEEEDALDIL